MIEYEDLKADKLLHETYTEVHPKSRYTDWKTDIKIHMNYYPRERRDVGYAS